MFEPTVRLNRTLWTKVKQCAEAGGYSSPDEFVGTCSKRRVARLLERRTSDEEILRKLKGLGYLE